MNRRRLWAGAVVLALGIGLAALGGLLAASAYELTVGGH